MTTTRPELVVEGAEDGQEWRAYEFKWTAEPIAELSAPFGRK